MKQLLNSLQRYLSQEYLLEQLRNCQDGTNPAQKLQRGHPTWKDMLENVLIGTANWQTQRRSNCTKFRILVWTIINSSIQAGRTQISGGLSEVYSKISLDMLVRGTNWKTRHSVVGQQTCSISHWMDRSMRRTLGSFDFIHSSHKWLLTTLVMWVIRAQHCRLGLCQDSDFGWVILTIQKSTSGGILCVFGSHTFVPRSWMCKKQISFTQFYRKWNHFVGCWSTYGWFTCSRFLGHGDWNFTFKPKTKLNPNILATRKTGAVLDSKTKAQHVTRKQKGWPIEWGGSRTQQHTFFSQWV